MPPQKQSYFDWWRRIASMTHLTAVEKAVLQCLASYADWETGGRAFPDPKLMQADTSLGERTVRRTLRSLSCRPSPGVQRCEQPRCRHLGLIYVDPDAPSARRTTTYVLDLGEAGFQYHLPEVGEQSAAGELRTSPAPPAPPLMMTNLDGLDARIAQMEWRIENHPASGAAARPQLASLLRLRDALAEGDEQQAADA